MRRTLKIANEFLCDRYEVPCPAWVHHPRYTLATPWYGDNKSTSIEEVRQHRIETAPTPFARRNIFCGNRLYQNKYEMSAWAQEARAKGIKDPAQIWQYARQKEISIHGG